MAGLSNKERLAEINKQASELENSEYNTAKVSKENMDYYSKTLADYAKSKREAEYGLSPEETAAARQGYAETTNLARQNALTAGGGTLGKYINATLNAGQGQFATQLAAQDADIKRQKQQQSLAYLSQLGQASSISQDVATQNFQKQIMAEQAIGQAESDWYAQRDQRRASYINAAASLGGAAITGGASVLAAGAASGAKAATPPK
jgi:negative regulator of genetic competence, sporulation and motility